VKNLILKQGQLVKALESVNGLVKGQRYLVESTGLGQGLRLTGQGLTAPLDLVDALGSCLDLTESVAVVQCPVVLPIGQGSGQAVNAETSLKVWSMFRL